MWRMDSSGLPKRGVNSAFNENRFCGLSQRSRTNELNNRLLFRSRVGCLKFLLPPKPNLILRNQTLKYEFPLNRTVQGYAFFKTKWTFFCPPSASSFLSFQRKDWPKLARFQRMLCCRYSLMFGRLPTQKPGGSHRTFIWLLWGLCHYWCP